MTGTRSNPKQLDRLRDRFSVAGAKDDRRDGYVLADSVRTDRRLFRRLHVADPRLVELRAWSRLAEELQEERVRLLTTPPILSNRPKNVSEERLLL